MHDGADTYCFTGKQLRSLASLMRRVGLVLWQQALLFPQHITKLGMLRLDDPNNLHVEEVRLEEVGNLHLGGKEGELAEQSAPCAGLPRPTSCHASPAHFPRTPHPLTAPCSKAWTTGAASCAASTAERSSFARLWRGTSATLPT